MNTIDELMHRLKELEAVVNAQSNEILRIKNDHYWPNHHGARIDHHIDYVDKRIDRIDAQIVGIIRNLEYHEDVGTGYGINDAVDEALEELDFGEEE